MTSLPLSPLGALAARVAACSKLPLVQAEGCITQAAADGYHVQGLSNFLTLGSLVQIWAGAEPALAEVVRLDKTQAWVRAFDAQVAFKLNTRVTAAGHLALSPHASWKGRMLNALGQPIDGMGPLSQGPEFLTIDNMPPAALRRGLIAKPLRTGIKAIDIFMPLCCGQRIGIFAGSGVGKSTLLGMLARPDNIDTVVVVLVGERGREVREYAETALGQDRTRVISVVATGDESPLMRRLAPKTGMRLAEYFRDRGENVLLMMDSVTRYAHAARDVALAAGEVPVARGYPPSIFSDLPQLLERAGPGLEGQGCITGIFSVLVDGDDHNDPVADAIRGTLDGHIVLRRAIAEQGRYPAIDVLSSISRLSHLAWTADQRKLVQMLQSLVARYEDSRDLRAMGGYVAGADPELDRAIAIIPKLYSALAQRADAGACLDAFADVAAALSAP